MHGELLKKQEKLLTFKIIVSYGKQPRDAPKKKFKRIMHNSFLLNIIIIR